MTVQKKGNLEPEYRRMDRKIRSQHTDVREFVAEDDPTGEAPILDPGLVASQVAGPVADDGVVDPNVLALRRVDAEVRRLMENWVELENQLKDRDSEIWRLRDWAGGLEEDLRATRQELAAARTDCERLRGEVIDRSAEVESRRHQADARSAEAESLRTELGAAQGRLDEVTAEVRLGRESTEQLTGRLAEHRDALVGMAAQLRQAEKSSQGLDSEKAELAARIADAEQRFADLASRYQDSEAARRQAEKDVPAAERRARDLEGELARARESAANIERKLEEKAAVIRSLEAASREHEQARTSLTGQIRKAEAALSAAQREAEAAGSARLAELQGQVDTERDRAVALVGEIKAREQTIDQLQTALDGQRQKTERAENSGSRTEELLQEARARVAALGQVEEQTASLRDALAAAEAAGRAAGAERAKLLDQIAGRDAVADDLRQRIGDLEADREQLLARMQEMRDKAAAVDSEFQAKRKAIAVLGDEIDRLALIQANVRRLDSMMSQQLSSKVPAPSAAEKPRNDRLIVWLDGSKAMKFPLYKPNMVIGRSKDSDIRVTGGRTSRRHAHIFVEGDAVVIEDLGSLNGLTVNDESVRRKQLHDGDILDVGGARLRYMDLDERVAAHASAVRATN